LLRLPSSLDDLSIDQLYSRYGRPDTEPIVRLDTPTTPSVPNLPPYVVFPISFGNSGDEIGLDEAKLVLIDFGVAFRPSEKSRFKSNSPLVLRPPEAFFEPTIALTSACDVWTLGWVIFELIAHRSLIDGSLCPQDEVTAQQVELQGKMPLEWCENWDQRSEWFDEAARPLRNPSSIWSWERRFEQWVQSPRCDWDMETIGDEERVALFKLLGSMLAWKPSDRPDMESVIKTEWMTKWALPTYQKGLGNGATQSE